jgi:diguanylate cyclase (GGDEF)-like protein
MRSGSRQGDILARLGGDEFVVVLEDVGSEAVAVEVMQRLQQSLQESTGVLGEPFRPSASIGLAMYPRDGETADVLLRAADLNMYRAKQREGACGPKKCDPAG